MANRLEISVLQVLRTDKYGKQVRDFCLIGYAYGQIWQTGQRFLSYRLCVGQIWQTGQRFLSYRLCVRTNMANRLAISVLQVMRTDKYVANRLEISVLQVMRTDKYGKQVRDFCLIGYAYGQIWQTGQRFLSYRLCVRTNMANRLEISVLQVMRTDKYGKQVRDFCLIGYAYGQIWQTGQRFLSYRFCVRTNMANRLEISVLQVMRTDKYGKQVRDFCLIGYAYGQIWQTGQRFMSYRLCVRTNMANRLEISVLQVMRTDKYGKQVRDFCLIGYAYGQIWQTGQRFLSYRLCVRTNMANRLEISVLQVMRTDKYGKQIGQRFLSYRLCVRTNMANRLEIYVLQVMRTENMANRLEISVLQVMRTDKYGKQVRDFCLIGYAYGQIWQTGQRFLSYRLCVRTNMANRLEISVLQVCVRTNMANRLEISVLQVMRTDKYGKQVRDFCLIDAYEQIWQTGQRFCLIGVRTNKQVRDFCLIGYADKYGKQVRDFCLIGYAYGQIWQTGQRFLSYRLCVRTNMANRLEISVLQVMRTDKYGKQVRDFCLIGFAYGQIWQTGQRFLSYRLCVRTNMANRLERFLSYRLCVRINMENRLEISVLQVMRTDEYGKQVRDFCLIGYAYGQIW